MLRMTMVAVIVLTIVTPWGAVAQGGGSVLTIAGGSPSAGFGRAVTSLDNGYAAVVEDGSVVIYDLGTDPALEIHRYLVPQAMSGERVSIDEIPDLDLDGNQLSELAIGLPDQGVVYIFTNPTSQTSPSSSPDTVGSAFWTLSAADLPIAQNDGAGFGFAVAGCNYDGDAYGDLAVGAPRADTSVGIEAGLAVIFDGWSIYNAAQGGPGGIAYEYWVGGEGGGAKCGWTVENLGQVDLDTLGRDEVGIGAPFYTKPGTGPFNPAIVGAGWVNLASDTSGDWVAYGLYDFEFLGFTLSVIPDANNDGFPEVVSGSPIADANGLTGNGIIVFLEGDNGARLLISNGTDGIQDRLAGAQSGDAFGWSISGAGSLSDGLVGDFDNDGVPDFAVGAPQGANPIEDGYVNVYTAANAGGGAISLTTIATMTGIPNGGSNWTLEKFGTSLTGLGDLNGDGYDEIGIGGFGYMKVVTGAPLTPAAGMVSVGSSCAPGVTLSGTAPLAWQWMSFSLTGAPPSKMGYLFFGSPLASPAPLGGGCEAYLAPPVGPCAMIATDSLGQWQDTLAVPGSIFVGLQITVQGVLLDVGGPLVGGSATTNGLNCTIGY